MTRPIAPPLEPLSLFERLSFQLASKMHTGPLQQICLLGQREIGARIIRVALAPLLEIHGVSHVAEVDRSRTTLLTANHRSFFDMFVVMAILFQKLPGWSRISFPVRGRYFYQSTGGVLLNALIANFAMYPPLFNEPRTRSFDRWSLDEVSRLCAHPGPSLVGYHPEGTRNKTPDPWSLLPARSGIGKIILESRPNVVPVFIGGLSNSVRELLHRRSNGGEKVRIWFGNQVEIDDLITEGVTGTAAYRRITDRVMEAIRELSEKDRAVHEKIKTPSDLPGRRDTLQ